MDSAHNAALRLADMLREQGLTLSLAESCTGGLLSEMLTKIPGSSIFFAGCAVTYSNESKMRILGVKEKTLTEYGAVSVQTAEEMVVGVMRAYGSDVSASVTGIAGPSGGTADKPVGTVCIAVCFDGVVSKTLHLTGDRDRIRIESAENTFNFIAETIS